MLTTPVQSPEEAAGNATFDALLWALSRPGMARTLPEPSDSPIIDALIDRECKVHCNDPLLVPQILRSGANQIDIVGADHVFLAVLDDIAALDDVAKGSDLYPDDGATVVLQVTLDRGPRVQLSGPGVDGTLALRIGGLPAGFWQRRAALSRYPMGFDLFLRDGAQVVGIPRSTKVEVL
ncbi:phosphonate C-P lyase system protein PhnH [Rhodobacterales bacterium 52_120_T64]|nr:phosphonate C-P lyase system protein PhnH [Rhodobacterales bacterium 52_120_T64]